MTLTEIRKLVIIAMFSDDVLFEKLVLKGGNALDLLYHIGARSSRDVDFSVEEDFPDADEVERRIVAALNDRFDAVGYVVFDVNFERVSAEEGIKSLGYRVQFKIIKKTQLADILREGPEDQRLDTMRRISEVVGPGQKRIFTIDISVGEFCSPNLEVELDQYTVRAYSPAMIAIEKVRAICQQMSEYGRRARPGPRARDFYDIHSIVNEYNVNLLSEENLELFRNIFSAKDVSLKLLHRIEETREFHRPDWVSVEISTSRELKEFDYYFDFVVFLTRQLKALGIVDAP